MPPPTKGPAQHQSPAPHPVTSTASTDLTLGVWAAWVWNCAIKPSEACLSCQVGLWAVVTKPGSLMFRLDIWHTWTTDNNPFFFFFFKFNSLVGPMSNSSKSKKKHPKETISISGFRGEKFSGSPVLRNRGDGRDRFCSRGVRHKNTAVPPRWPATARSSSTAKPRCNGRAASGG